MLVQWGRFWKKSKLRGKKVDVLLLKPKQSNSPSSKGEGQELFAFSGGFLHCHHYSQYSCVFSISYQLPAISNY